VIRVTAAKYFMVATLLVWGVLDIFFYFKFGNAGTESATTWHYGYEYAGITFFVGSLMGHFFGQWRAPSTAAVQAPLWRRIGEVVLLCLMTVWLLLDVRGLFRTGLPSFIDTYVWAAVDHRVWLIFGIGFVTGSVFLPMDDPTLPEAE
jgi:hypothetical protein